MNEQKLESVDHREFERYIVVEVDDIRGGGFEIIDSLTNHPIFGQTMTQEEDRNRKIKAHLYYWVQHLNMAFTNGFLSREGKMVYHSKGSWENLDRNYRIMTGAEGINHD